MLFIVVIFDLELDFAGTDFQKKVWAALLTIPFGETRTYSQIAEQIGKAVLRFDVTIADLGLEQRCDLGAEAQAELVGVRGFEIVVHQENFSAEVAPRNDQRFERALSYSEDSCGFGL